MEKPSAFENVIEWINWIKIVLSPAILCAIIGVAIYLSMEDKATGAFLLVFIIAIGVGLGVFWANKIKKKHGSTHFISRSDASPDIDDFR